jgi:hypothetical protein
MFATVKKVIKNRSVELGGHWDTFPGNEFIGKRIPVEPIKEWRGWYRGGEKVGYNWHCSWLKFAAKKVKVGRSTSPNSRVKQGLKPHAKRTS